MQQNKALPCELAASVPILALPGVYTRVAAANLPALQASLQFSDLWQELIILQRLYYKNRNQHKASKHLQGIGQVCNTLKLFRQLQLPELIQDLHAAAQRTSLPELAEDTAGAAAAGGSKRHRQQSYRLQQEHNADGSRQTVLLPSFQAGCWVLRRLMAGCQMLLRCNSVILSTAEHLSGQLSYGYFMPFCLVAVACLARLRVLAVHGLMQLLQAYNSIMILLPLLPVHITHDTSVQGSIASSSKNSSRQQLYLDPSGVQDLPHMLKLAWQGPTPHLQCIPFDSASTIADRAAQLQETFCISRPSAPVAPRPAAAAGCSRDRLATGSGRDAGGSDLGESIGREEFESLLLLRQQQHQQEQEHQRPAPAAAALKSAPLAEALVYEDRQATLPPSATTVNSAQAAPPAQAGVPMYNTAQGSGLGLGLGLGMNVGLGLAHNNQQQQQQPPGLAVGQPLKAAAERLEPVATAAGSSAMCIDSSMGPEDLCEFAALYGTDSLNQDTQQQQAAAAAAAAGPTAVTTETAASAPASSRAPGSVLLSQVPCRGVVAVKRQRLGGSAAAALAMQGPDSSSSDDEIEDAAVAPVQFHSAVGITSARTVQAGQGMAVEQQQQQQQEYRLFALQAAINPSAGVAPPPQSATVALSPVVTGQQMPLLGVEAPVTAVSVEPPVVPAVPAVAHAEAAAVAGINVPTAAANGAALLAEQHHGGSQQHQAMDIDQPVAPAAATDIAPAPLVVGKKAVKREAARKREKQQQQILSQQDWVMQLLTTGTAATAVLGRPPTPLAAPAATSAGAAKPGATASTSKLTSSNGRRNKKAVSKQGSQSSAGEGGSSSEAAGGRDLILDMLLGGL